jgi:hypothetical protein
MRIRLTKKLANVLNGVDLTQARVGRLMTLPDRDGEMLIAEGWAVPYFRARTVAIPPAEVGDQHRSNRRVKR